MREIALRPRAQWAALGLVLAGPSYARAGALDVPVGREQPAVARRRATAEVNATEQNVEGANQPSSSSFASPVPLPAPSTDPSLVIAGPSTCPLPADVWKELGTLIPSEHLAHLLSQLSASALPVQILDLGVPYRIIAAGRVRDYRDDARDCAHRARVAAVFVALALDPASFAYSTPQPLPRNEDVVVRGDSSVRWDLGAVVDGALGGDDRTAHWGAGLRVSIGSRALTAIIGAAALAPSDTTLSGVRLHQWRLPVDIGVRVRILGHSVEPFGDIALGVAIISERALDLAESQGQTGVEFGGWLAAGVRFAARAQLSPFVAVRAELVPSPPSVYALPRGVIGHTPYGWLGATLGASWGF